MISFVYRPGPAYFALFACIASAIAEPGPIVSASIGSALGPQMPEKVLLSLRMRHPPSVTVRCFGLSIVAVGCTAANAETPSVEAMAAARTCARKVRVGMSTGYYGARSGRAIR